MLLNSSTIVRPAEKYMIKTLDWYSC